MFVHYFLEHCRFAAIIEELKKQKILQDDSDGARGNSMEKEKLQEELVVEKLARS